MKTGLDRLDSGFHEGLAGKRIALLCNHTAVDRWGRHAVEVLRRIEGLEIVRLLAPEHGLWGTHQDMEAVEDRGTSVDPFLGLPVVSLYGSGEESLRPRPEALEGVDALVYDVQDIGARYYTFAATLALSMETAAEAGVPVWVLDRPNPLGNRKEGPLLREGFTSFVGLEPGLPIRHGLTVGALAHWYRARRAPNCELHVVACDRHARVDWVPTSPNMPTLDTAFVYPGMCLLEGTTLSEGRGTTTPFQLFGAPGIDPVALCRELRLREVPGVDFLPRVFRPEFGKHAGEACGGAWIRVNDHSCIPAVWLGVHVLDAIRKVAPGALRWRTDAYEFVSDRLAIDLLWGGAALRECLDGGGDVIPLLEAASKEAAGFRA